ncbi:unnamed protein product [Darwinula stevensoni]|uniref:Elongation of very long chain fatty acids protein n=1 Tax=Darwinula stevensoni TaxID=69355 RepID=A0A7R9A8J8_9CRUS|nr:unnamed protein product [Darwinula stevensoni]CAG0896510.1 unnamed protein product [Darwinula stevensoni]
MEIQMEIEGRVGGEWNLSSSFYRFPFEKTYDFTEVKDWAILYFQRVLLLALVFYPGSVLFGKKAMKSGGDLNLELRLPLICWNAALAAFSFFGSFRSLPELLRIWSHHGFRSTVCDSRNLRDGVAGVWVWYWVASKPWELGDTGFLVLRRRPLSFLHLFHHATVIVNAWFGFIHGASILRWLTNLNYTIHALMYTYYTLRAAGYRVSRRLAMFLTSAQILQLAAGFSVSLYSLAMRLLGEACHVTYETLALTIPTNLVYIILFCRFFIGTYFKRKRME